MRLGVSYLKEHKFKHGFHETINPICICRGDIESINHFFLHCPEHCEARQIVFENIDEMLSSQNESSLTHLLVYGDPKHNPSVNAFILNSAIEFILSSGRFNGPLFNGAEHIFLFLWFIFHMAFSLLLFIDSVLLFILCTYIRSVCNFFTSGFVGC